MHIVEIGIAMPATSFWPKEKRAESGQRNPSPMRGVMKTAQEAVDCKRAASLNDTTKTGLKTVTKTPLLNRIYLVRSQLMVKAVKTAVPSSRDNSTQLLILGAGLDTTYDQFADKVFAVDYSDVLGRRPTALSGVAHVSADLSKPEELLSELFSAGFCVDYPTVVLAECVLSYIEKASLRRLLSVLGRVLAQSLVITYDPLLAYEDTVVNGFAAKMHSRFAERDAPLLGCSHDLEQYSALFTATGYEHVNATTINQATRLYLSHEERTAGSNCEPFDEFASLAVIHRHYGMCVAGTCPRWFQSTLTALTSQQGRCAAERQRALDCRLACAELRLQRLEQQAVERRKTTGGRDASVAVRRALEDDTLQLVPIYEQAFSDYAEKYRSVQKYVRFSSKALKNASKTYPEASGSTLFVATQNNALCGCIGVKMKAPRAGGDGKGTAEISHFCVARAEQRGGIGSALLREALDYCATQLGTGGEVCLTVLKDLEAARSLYAKVGFSVVKSEDLGDDCELIFMRLIIT